MMDDVKVGLSKIWPFIVWIGLMMVSYYAFAPLVTTLIFVAGVLLVIAGVVGYEYRKDKEHRERILESERRWEEELDRIRNL